MWETGTNGPSLADPYALKVPHCLAVCENLGLICVADREHGRIQCFDVDNGGFRLSLTSGLFGENIYGMDCVEVAGKRIVNYIINGYTYNVLINILSFSIMRLF